MTDDQPWKDTNTLIYNQIGQPPPAGVLATVVELAGAVPGALVATVAWGEDSTTWEVVGVTETSMFRVTGKKALNEWRGGSAGDDGEGEEIDGDVYPLSRLSSLHYALLRAYRGMSSWADSSTSGQWTARFDQDRVVVFSDTKPKMSQGAIDGVAEVAARLRGMLN